MALNQYIKKWIYPMLLVLSGVSVFIIPIIKLMQGICIVRDWGYFNTLSLTSRSMVLHYHTFPVHNPWLFGGADIIANPQTRVFSPFFIYDLLFFPPLANLLALTTLAIIGSFGMYSLLQYLNLKKNIALLGSILFIHGSWFALHFSEGHIAYGSFLLLGLSFYFILRIREKKFKIYYALLNAFFILDGGFYTFIFTNILFVFSVFGFIEGLSPKSFFLSVIRQWKESLLGLSIFAMLASAKLIPMLWLYGNRLPILEFQHLSPRVLFHCFFDPFQHIFKDIHAPEVKCRFHEIGSYVGIVGVLIIIFFLIKNFQKKFIPYILLTMLFFWTGAGIIEKYNPWLLFQKIPIVHNAHIQSRLFILCFLFFIILLSYSINYIGFNNRKAWFNILFVFFVAESLLVSTYPFYRVVQPNYDVSTYSSYVLRPLIHNDNIEKTNDIASVDWGFDFFHFYKKNTGAKMALDPAIVQGEIKSIKDTDYKGEIYLLSGTGQVKMNSYLPGKINLSYNLDSTATIQLNTNYLLGWSSTDKNVTVENRNGLVTITPKNLTGTVELRYTPQYLYIIFPLYVLGIVIAILCLVAIYKRKFSFKDMY
jgi:hypothetical protein